MSYKKAADILPKELLELIQQYVDGEYMYIPKLAENKSEWGANTSTKKELRERNTHIYKEYLDGSSVASLSDRYYLSVKSIQRILQQEKSKHRSML